MSEQASPIAATHDSNVIDVESGLPETASTARSSLEVLAIALVLVASAHAMPYWILMLLPARELYQRWGPQGYFNFHDALSGLMPLVLCCATPLRSGLIAGYWRGLVWKAFSICALPIILTAVIYPFTAKPFTGERIGMWAISPLSQDLLFTGYLYGLLDAKFGGAIHGRIPVRKAVLLTAVFFSLWHVPNFMRLQASYVVFQLIYTFLGGAWVLLARQITRSIWPGVLTHAAVNFIAWKGW